MLNRHCPTSDSVASSQLPELDDMMRLLLRPPVTGGVRLDVTRRL